MFPLHFSILNGMVIDIVHEWDMLPLKVKVWIKSYGLLIIRAYVLIRHELLLNVLRFCMLLNVLDYDIMIWLHGCISYEGFMDREVHQSNVRESKSGAHTDGIRVRVRTYGWDPSSGLGAWHWSYQSKLPRKTGTAKEYGPLITHHSYKDCKNWWEWDFFSWAHQLWISYLEMPPT